MRGLLLVGAALFVLASSTLAASDTAPAPALTGKMTNVQYLVGTWRCVVAVPAQAKMAARTVIVKGVYDIAPGNTIRIEYVSTEFSSAGYIGFTPSKNLWWTSSANGSGDVSFKTGVDSSTNVLSLSGTDWVQGHAFPIRVTITKISDTSFRVVTESKDDKWSVDAESSCSKTSNR